MRKHPFTRLLLLLPVALACSERPPTGVDPSPPPQLGALQWTFDDEMARIAREEIPGFAGYYFEDQNAVILLVDASYAPLATRYFEGVRAPLQIPPGAVTRIKPARWDFPTLLAWRDRLMEFLGRGGIYSLDIDEVNNNVRVGTADPAAGAALVAAAGRLGIPTQAVVAEVEGAPEPRLTLLDFQRPVAGGIQIQNFSSGKICTLGFNAIYNSTAYFVTAAHCSGTQFKGDNSVEHQPTQLFARIAQEFIDPPLVKRCLRPGSFFFWPCRYSDASLFRYDPGMALERGRLMQTTGSASGQRGSVVILDAQPYLDVTQKWAQGAAPVGTQLQKVGRTSGWTVGTVTRTCVMFSPLWCQWVSSIWSEGGDSGSPIFALLSPSSVALHGVLWGGPTNDFNTTYHSPLTGIENDFNTSDQFEGSLSVCIATVGC